MTDHKKTVSVSVEQSKLLGNTLRVNIIAVLIDEPKTAKQVATILGESPGNVHYHMKKLAQGNLIKLVKEKPVGGVIEKYYKAVAEKFESSETVYHELLPHFKPKSSTQMGSAIRLTEEDQEALLKDFHELIKKWLVKTSKADRQGAEEFVIGVKLVSRKEKQGKE